MKQSAAFKILRTRLKTVPSFSGEQRKRMVSGNPLSQVLQYTQIGIRSVDHDNKNQDAGNVYNGINFASMLQLFEHMQNRHRMHSRPQRQFNNSLSSFSQVCTASSTYMFCNAPLVIMPGGIFSYSMLWSIIYA
eukprot:TRINITY_DN9832_c0_g3_i5.p1 TRINITY_DN9832_c0_g3~~TRINITY_DN9832_c0_g3_i5.p1  ORF type:complete len:134 (-),score=13.57 TRINITY_DN9832_c0_g3_i5:137-538(-)